jgi:hypothetical protein
MNLGVLGGPMFSPGSYYSLPDGVELIASGDGTSFYAATDHDNAVVRYELNENGQFLLEGLATPWSIEDLKELTPDVDAPVLT